MYSLSLSLIIILLKDKGYAPDAVLKYLTLIGGGYTQTVDNSIEYDSLEDLVTKVHIYSCNGASKDLSQRNVVEFLFDFVNKT